MARRRTAQITVWEEAAEMARASTHPEQPARETNLRMNRWREHLGDDPLDGFGGRGPAEYHYMATHEPEGPGLTRFGNLQLEGDDLAARLDEIREANTGENWEHLSAEQVQALDEAASALRASTHPKQSARVELLEAALLPFALAHEQRDDDSTVGGPPVAVQVGGQTHGDDPWEFAARALELTEGDR